MRHLTLISGTRALSKHICILYIQNNLYCLVNVFFFWADRLNVYALALRVYDYNVEQV